MDTKWTCDDGSVMTQPAHELSQMAQWLTFQVCLQPETRLSHTFFPTFTNVEITTLFGCFPQSLSLSFFCLYSQRSSSRTQFCRAERACETVNYPKWNNQSEGSKMKPTLQMNWTLLLVVKLQWLQSTMSDWIMILLELVLFSDQYMHHNIAQLNLLEERTVSEGDSELFHFNYWVTLSWTGEGLFWLRPCCRMTLSPVTFDHLAAK